MTINEAIRYLRLPAKSTQEDLEMKYSTVLNYGDKVVLDGYYYNGGNKSCYFGACYEFLTDDTTCEGETSSFSTTATLSCGPCSSKEKHYEAHFRAVWESGESPTM